LARWDLVRYGLAYDRDSLLLSIGAKIINAKEERWETLKFAASATPLEAYDEWYRRLHRPIDINGLDRARHDWRLTPVIRLILSLDNGGVEALKATILSLRRQAYGRWSLHACISELTPHDLLAVFRQEMAQDPRLNENTNDAGFLTLGPNFNEHDGIVVVGIGDLLPDHTLAVLAETLAQEPHVRIAYGDEDSITATGELHSPLFKPNWSPIFFDGLAYLGRLTCIRATHLMAIGLRNINELVCNEASVLERAVKYATTNDIRHIRRILYRRQREAGEEPNDRRPVATSSPVVAVGNDNAPEVSIIIPTRDRADLLTQCLKSLKGLTDYPRYDLIIVDNGSEKLDALAQLRDLRSLPRHQVLHQPGPFNFSRLCNAGARAANSPMLVFLNNDVVIIDPQWLRILVRWAVQPDVGVVGAKLLFPNNTIEHAGVVLGHGGIAGHIYHRQPAAQSGYLGQLLVPHEVEAVTGACIAIERAKFEAVDGFYANYFPVEFNDIDLCLRTAEWGWTTIWTPESILYHLQSASRGYPIKPYKVFRKERDHFLKCWTHVIRDDRYFHPALSLFSHKPALA